MFLVKLSGVGRIFPSQFNTRSVIVLKKYDDLFSYFLVISCKIFTIFWGMRRGGGDRIFKPFAPEVVISYHPKMERHKSTLQNPNNLKPCMDTLKVENIQFYGSKINIHFTVDQFLTYCTNLSNFQKKGKCKAYLLFYLLFWCHHLNCCGRQMYFYTILGSLYYPFNNTWYNQGRIQT